MKRFDDSRDELLFLQRNVSREAYLDHIWSERYPQASPPASKAWPFQPLSEQRNVISISKGKTHAGVSGGSSAQR